MYKQCLLSGKLLTAAINMPVLQANYMWGLLYIQGQGAVK